MTPVMALSPASAVGKLVDGVMITPVTEAPTGTTLEIKRSSAPPASARAVGFGGIDPPGGAFDLPVIASTDTTLSVSTFGGYGIAAPATRHVASDRVTPVPCQRPTRASSADVHARASAEAPMLISCVSQAARDQNLTRAQLDAWAANPPGVQREVATNAVFESVSEPILDEMRQVLDAKPTEEGVAELEQLNVLGADVLRDAQLAGVDPEVTQGVHDGLYAAAAYHCKLIKSICQGPQQPSSDIFVSYLYEAIASGQQMELMGAAPDDIASVTLACANRIKFQLDVSNDATVDRTGGWTSHVVITDSASVTSADLQFHAAGTTLSYQQASSKADPSFAASGGSATMVSENGTLALAGMEVLATRHPRCDINGKFFIERHTYLFLNSAALWDDQQQVQLAENGQTGGLPPAPEAVASIAWLQDYAPKSPRFQLEFSKPPFTRQDSGSCVQVSGDGCTTFSYNASIKLTALPK